MCPSNKVNRHLLSFPLTLLLVAGTSSFAQSESLIGTWRAVDKKGDIISTIEVYSEGDLLSARIVRIQDSNGKELSPLCEYCSEPFTGKAVVGMRFIWNRKQEGEKWIDGRVINLQQGIGQGVVASCELELVGKRAKILGRWGPFFGTSFWERDSGSRWQQ